EGGPHPFHELRVDARFVDRRRNAAERRELDVVSGLPEDLTGDGKLFGPEARRIVFSVGEREVCGVGQDREQCLRHRSRLTFFSRKRAGAWSWRSPAVQRTASSIE